MKPGILDKVHAVCKNVGKAWVQLIEAMPSILDRVHVLSSNAEQSLGYPWWNPSEANSNPKAGR